MTDDLRLEDRGYGYIAKVLNRCKSAIADYVKEDVIMEQKRG